MNFDDEHAGRTSTWHPSPGGEKGKRHVEDQQTCAITSSAVLWRLFQVVFQRERHRRRTVVFALRRRIPLLVLLLNVAAGSPDFTLRIAEVGPFEPVDPTFNDSASLLIKDLVYESLLVANDMGEVVPLLARAWKQLPNGDLYVEPNTDRFFSDNSPVTLQDVIDSLLAAGLNPSPLGAGLELARGIGRLRPEVALLRAPIFKRTPSGFLGTGPYFIFSQERDQIVLQRAVHVPHRIDQVVLVAYPTPADVMKALAKGDCNGAVGVSATAVEWFFAYMSQFHILPVPQVHRQAIIFNRKMLSAKDRKILLPALQSAGLETIIPGYSVPVSAIPISLGNGERIPVLTWNADWAYQRLALAIRRILGLRGGEVIALPPEDAANAFSQGKFGIAISPIQTWPEAEALSRWHTGGSFSATGYSNPALDAALDAGDWNTARQEFDLDPPGVFLQEWTTFAIFDSRIFNPTIGRYRRLETLPAWEVP